MKTCTFKCGIILSFWHISWLFTSFLASMCTLKTRTRMYLITYYLKKGNKLATHANIAHTELRLIYTLFYLKFLFIILRSQFKRRSERHVFKISGDSYDKNEGQN